MPILLTIAGLMLLIQYAIFVLVAIDNSFSSKKEFFIFLIPFGWVPEVVKKVIVEYKRINKL